MDIINFIATLDNKTSPESPPVVRPIDEPITAPARLDAFICIELYNGDALIPKLNLNALQLTLLIVCTIFFLFMARFFSPPSQRLQRSPLSSLFDFHVVLENSKQPTFLLERCIIFSYGCVSVQDFDGERAA